MPSIINSDDGVVSGTSGLKSTGGNDGITAFQQNGTERMRIDSSGNVGIGTASPTSGGSWTYVTVAGKSTTQGGVVEVYNSDSTLKGQLYAYNGTINLNAATNHPLIFLTNNAERARFNAGAPILCLSGGNTSATGTGIAFPATQSASSDANTLDDYEEGTFTLSNGGNTTYTTRSGRYTKIGNFVKCSFFHNINTIGTGSATTLSGLPFTPSSTAPTINGGVVTYVSGLAVSALALGVYADNAGQIIFMTRNANDTNATTQLPAVMGNSFAVYAEVSYLID